MLYLIVVADEDEACPIKLMRVWFAGEHLRAAARNASHEEDCDHTHVQVFTCEDRGKANE